MANFEITNVPHEHKESIYNLITDYLIANKLKYDEGDIINTDYTEVWGEFIRIEEEENE